MKLNKIEITILGFIIFIIFGIGYFTHPFSPTAAEQKLDDKIESAEAFRDEARALALSMPLLPDTIVNSVADSLLVTLVTLNRDWVIFVLTEEGFEKYTDDIEELNRSLESIRMDYEITKTFRNLRKSIKGREEIQRNGSYNLKNKGYEI